MSSLIINTQQLSEILDYEYLIIIDARAGKDAYDEYLQKHIKGSRFLDLEKDLAEKPEDPANGGRHPLPDPIQFVKKLENIGVTDKSRVIIYDDKNGANAAARLWWMLRSLGFDNVQVLDGGLQNAEKMKIPFSSGSEIFAKGTINGKTNWQYPIVTMEEVEKEISAKTATVIDVRDAYRYKGEDEPIDLVAGHIPGAINIPFSENLDEKGNFLTSEILQEKYTKFLKNKPQKLIIHCGSGVTACHTILALQLANFEIPALYVGSWSEWSRNNKPIAKEDNL